MPDNSVKIILEAVDKTKAAWNELKNNTDTVFASIKKNWLELTAVGLSIKKALDWTELGAKALQVKESFRLITESMNIEGDKLIAKMRETSYTFVDETDLMLKAQKALAQGLSENQIIKIMEAARVASRFMGVDVSEAFDRVMDAITNLQTRGLKGAFTIDVQSAVESYAKKLGITAGELSEFARMQAITNAVVEEAERKSKALGNALEPTLSEKIQKAKSAFDEFKTIIGEGFVSVLMAGAGAINGFNAAFWGMTGIVLEGLELIQRAASYLPDWLGGKQYGEGAERIKALKDQVLAIMDDLSRKGNEMLSGAYGMVFGGAKEGKTSKGAYTPPSSIDPEAKRKADEERLKLEREYQAKIFELGNQTLAKKLVQLDIEEKQAIASAKKIGASTLDITKYYAEARVEATKEWDKKIAEGFSMKGYEAAEDKWQTEALNFLNEYEKGLLNLDKDYLSLNGNVNDLILNDKQLEDLEIKELRDQGKLTDGLLIKMRQVGEERRKQMAIAAEVEIFKYPAYEVPDIGWQTAGKAVVLEMNKSFIDLKKAYASIMGDTKALTALDKEEEGVYIAGLKNKAILTEEEEKIIQKTGEQRRNQMTIEYQFYQNISQVWGSHLASMLKGAESLKEGFKGIFKDMADYFIEMVSKMAMDWLFFENIQGGGKFLSGGSGLSSIVGWIGSLFSPAKGMAEGGIVPSWKPIAAFQEGGIANSPQLAMYGEGGPEAFVPLKGGKIPVQMMGGKGITIINQTINRHEWNCLDFQTAREFAKRTKGVTLEILEEDSNASNGVMRRIIKKLR